MIQLFHVYKNYEGGISALRDVTFQVGKGEFVFLTGPSGAGKTTLLRLLFCADRPTQGQIVVDGRNVSRLKAREIPYLRRRLGVIFQDFKLLNHKTVYENVAFTLKVMGLPSREIRKRVLKTLTYVGLQSKATLKPIILSGGEQQRVAIARAIVREPAILLADEPTGNLDPELTVDIVNLFKEINDQGTTVIVATHDRSLIERFKKRAIVLEKGRMVN